MILDAAAAVEEVYRSDWGRIVASLIRLVGDFDLAEESAQEAFAAAVEQWRASGIQLGTRQSTTFGAARGSRKNWNRTPSRDWAAPSKNRITTPAKFPMIGFG